MTRPQRTHGAAVRMLLAVVAVVILAACGADSGTGEEATTTVPAPVTTVPAPVTTVPAPVTTAPPTETKVLLLGHIRTTDTPWHVATELFAQLVEEKTNGAYKIDVFPNSELGGTVDMFSGMQAGSVDLMFSGITAYPFIAGAEPFNITAMPFLWKDHDSMQAVLDSELFEPLFEQAVANTGIRALAVRGEADTRELSSNKPIRTADDFAGLKIRIAASEMTNATFTALGAQPITVAFSELYTSLRSGIVDAQENGFATIRAASFYEVQDYLMPTHYIREIATMYISEATYQSLSPEHQVAFRDAAIESGDEFSRLMRLAMKADFEFLSQEMEVIEPDLDSIRAALVGAFDAFDGDLWPSGLEAKIREAQG